MPLLSIILPVFNGESTIETAITSVLKQTVSDWELVLINDGSNDDTDRICRKYEKKYKAIRLISQDNRGLSAARNAGLSIAKGDFVAFLDADDWVEPNYYEMLLQAIHLGNVDMVMSGYEREFWRGGRCRKVVEISSAPFEVELSGYFPKELEKLFSYNLFIHVWNKLYRRSCIEENEIRFDETLYFAEDVQFNLDYYRNTEKLYCLGGHGYHYICRNSGNLTAGWNEYLTEYNSMIYREVRDFLQDCFRGADLTIVSNMYLRGCFLNMEKALNGGISKKLVKFHITQVLNKAETVEILETSWTSKEYEKRLNLEFFYYRLFIRTRQTEVIYWAVRLRVWMKKLLKRL